jgi:DNA-binding IscR family transcriptional regulator
VTYTGPAEPLQRVWIAVRKNLRDVVEHVTLADLASGALPPQVDALADDADAWQTR